MPTIINIDIEDAAELFMDNDVDINDAGGEMNVGMLAQMIQ